MRAKLRETLDSRYAIEGDELEILGVQVSSKYGSGIGFLIKTKDQSTRYVDSGWFQSNSIVGEIKIEFDTGFTSVVFGFNE